MRPDEQPAAPSAPWRAASAFTMGAVGLLCKGFLSGLSRVETHGMEDFLQLLDEREQVEGRQKGLITGMRVSGLRTACWTFSMRAP
jgi:monolysocardiolipin acyltransferase